VVGGRRSAGRKRISFVSTDFSRDISFVGNTVAGKAEDSGKDSGVRSKGFGFSLLGVRGATLEVDTERPGCCFRKENIRTKGPNVKCREIWPRVATAYKRKADKVKPVDTAESDGSTPGGDPEWRKKVMAKEVYQPTKYSKYLLGKFSKVRRGSRVTPERVAAMGIDFLSRPEMDVFVTMLYNREAALAWEWPEIGRLKEEVAPPSVIRMVPHTPWQHPGFNVPRALRPTVVEMIDERLKQGLLEPCHGPYRNPWFLVKKGTTGKYRMVNAAMEYNRYTIRDANLPPSVDEFSETFAGEAISSLVDLFSGYDQMPLDVRSRDVTAMQTPRGLLRYTRLVQGATNSVAQFCRNVNLVFAAQIPARCEPFLDDIAVHGPKTVYNNEEVMPGVRRYVLEHIINLDKVLADAERAGLTVAGGKSQWLKSGVKIVGFVCDIDGRRPDERKVAKVIEWPACTSPKETREFLGLVIYYRIWVKGFAMVTAPLYYLLKKDVEFVWTEDQERAMNALKTALTTAPALVSIDYKSGGDIILAVDASLKGWGCVLMQVNTGTGKRHPARYESGLWNNAEEKYDATKRECRGLLKSLKKLRGYLYGVQFKVEIDANTLVAQLNKVASDLPGALVTRWLAWIRMFDFDVKHIAGKKHGAADALSRRPATEKDWEEREMEEDVDEFLDRALFAGLSEMDEIDTSPLPSSPLRGYYTEEHHRYARYLTTLRRPKGMAGPKFRLFKQSALKYLVRDGALWRRAEKGRSCTRVIDDKRERLKVLEKLHDEAGHKGREGTFQRLRYRYYWDQMFRSVSDYVRQCRECQFRANKRAADTMLPTWSKALWAKIAIDVVHMPASEGKHYLVVAREDVSGWPEARALANADAASIEKFLWEEVFTRHGCVGRIVVDGGAENKGEVVALAKRMGIPRVETSAYHPQANGMIERGHKSIVDGLAKMTDGGLKKWPKHLHAVLWAERTTVRQSTGETPGYLIYGEEPLLPAELEYPTWRVLPWEGVQTRAELLAMRARYLERRQEDLEEAIARVQRQRTESAERSDLKHSTKAKRLQVGDMVLLHQTELKDSHSSDRKLRYWWQGPYRVSHVNHKYGSYRIEELDGTEIKGTKPADRLKLFYTKVEGEERAARDAVEAVMGEGTESKEGNDGEVSLEVDKEPRRLQEAGTRLKRQQFSVVIPVKRKSLRQRGEGARNEYEGYSDQGSE
jgi:hypothetical protein